MEKAEDSGSSSTAGGAVGVPPEAYHITGIKKRLAALGLALVLFISALDNSIVAVALPAIGDDLHDYQTTSWVVTAYFLTYTAFLPILSKLTDIVGRRPVLVGSSIFFALWSGACGGAKTMTQLIVFRALQGVGASAIYSGVLLTISTMVPKHELPTFGSLIGVVFSVSSVAGPIVGGVIVQSAHWGWIFFINLPIAVVGSLLIWFTVHDPQVGKPSWKGVATRLDWLGSLCILAFSLLLCTPLQLGGTEGYPWSSALILAPLILAFAVLPVFLWLETKHSEPVIPLRLFRIRNTGIGILITMCIGAGFFLICLLLPQRMQLVNAQRPIMAGVRMLPLLAVTGLISALAGISVKIMRTFRPQLWIGLPLGAIGAGLLASLKVDSSFAPQYGFQALAGVSFGISIVLSTVAIQFSSDRRDLASAMGAQSFVRQIGGLVAVAIGTALINSRVNEAISNEGLPKQILVTPEQVLKSLPPDVLAVARNAYSTGFSRSFMVAAAWFVIGTVLSFGLVHQMPDEWLNSNTASDLEAASESAENKDNEPVTPKPDV